MKGSDIPGSPNAPIEGLSCRKILKTIQMLHKNYKQIKAMSITEFNPSIED